MTTIFSWLFPAWLLFGLGFGGDSESKTENKTEVADNRVVGGDSSANVSASGGSSVTVYATDHGAVSAGMSMGTKAVDAIVKSGDGFRTSTASMFKDALGAITGASSAANQQVAGAYSKVAGDLATAFTDSKAPDKSLLMVGGVVVVGLAGLMLFARKG